MRGTLPKGLSGLVLFCSILVGQNGWRMDGFNASRTGVTPAIGPSTLPTFTKIADVNGSLRRIGDDGSLIVVGQTALVAPTSATPYSTPISAFASSGGAPKWTVQFPSADGYGVKDVAVGRDGTVYASTTTSVTALNGATGAALWTPAATVTNSGNESSPLAIDSTGTLYFHTGGSVVGIPSKLTAITPATGKPKWDVQAGLRGLTQLVLSTDETMAYLIQGKTSFGSPIGDIAAVSTASGTLNQPTPGNCDPRGDVYAFAPSGLLYSGDINNALLAFPENVQTCTQVSTAGMIATGIVAVTAKNQVVIQLSNGSYGAVDALGAPLWMKGEVLNSGHADSNGTLYAIAPNTGDIVGFSITTGTELWRQHFATSASGLSISGDGALFVSAGTQLFSTSPQNGIIAITTNLTQSTFTISGPTQYVGSGTSFIETNVPSGTYTIVFSAVPGYATPPPQTEFLSPGGRIHFSGTYTGLVPTLIAQPPSLNLTYTIGAPTASVQVVAVSSNTPAVQFSVTARDSWLTVSPVAATTPASVSVTVSPSIAAALEPGQYESALVLSPLGITTSQLRVPVTLTIRTAVTQQFTLASPADEPSLTVDPRNPLHAVIGYNGQQGCNWAETVDGGYNWSHGALQFPRAPIAFSGLSDPWLRFGPDGKLYYSCIATTDIVQTSAFNSGPPFRKVGIFVATSKDGRAASFQTASTVNTVDQLCPNDKHCNSEGEFTDHPSLAILVRTDGATRIVVSWVDFFFNEARQVDNIFVRTAFSDDGDTWTATTVAGPQVDSATIGGGPHEIAVMWHELHEKGDGLIKMRSSTDGQHWSVVNPVDYVGKLKNGSTTSIVLSKPYALALPGQDLQLAWQRGGDNGSEVFFDTGGTRTARTLAVGDPTRQVFLPGSGGCPYMIGAYQTVQINSEAFQYKVWMESPVESRLLFSNGTDLSAHNGFFDRHYHMYRIGDYTSVDCSGTLGWAAWTEPHNSSSEVHAARFSMK